MARHVTITPLHDGKRAHAREIVHKLEEHLGLKSTPDGDGHRFELADEQYHDASDLSGALDTVAPDWREHISMGL